MCLDALTITGRMEANKDVLVLTFHRYYLKLFRHRTGIRSVVYAALLTGDHGLKSTLLVKSDQKAGKQNVLQLNVCV